MVSFEEKVMLLNNQNYFISNNPDDFKGLTVERYEDKILEKFNYWFDRVPKIYFYGGNFKRYFINNTNLSNERLTELLVIAFKKRFHKICNCCGESSDIENQELQLCLDCDNHRRQILEERRRVLRDQKKKNILIN